MMYTFSTEGHFWTNTAINFASFKDNENKTIRLKATSLSPFPNRYFLTKISLGLFNAVVCKLNFLHYIT
jgi:hypothetical protein